MPHMSSPLLAFPRQIHFMCPTGCEERISPEGGTAAPMLHCRQPAAQHAEGQLSPCSRILRLRPRYAIHVQRIEQ
jgi:hypothetical protein